MTIRDDVIWKEIVRRLRGAFISGRISGWVRRNWEMFVRGEDFCSEELRKLRSTNPGFDAFVMQNSLSESEQSAIVREALGQACLNRMFIPPQEYIATE